MQINGALTIQSKSATLVISTCLLWWFGTRRSEQIWTALSSKLNITRIRWATTKKKRGCQTMAFNFRLRFWVLLTIGSLEIWSTWCNFVWIMTPILQTLFGSLLKRENADSYAVHSQTRWTKMRHRLWRKEESSTTDISLSKFLKVYHPSRIPNSD